MKAQQISEEKKKRKAENKQQKPKGRGRGRGHGKQADEEGIQSEEDAEQEAEGAEAEGRKRAKAKVPRTRGQFAPSDPPVIANGPAFAASFKPELTVKIRDFVRRVLANEPAILRCKKGSVKKVLSFSLKNAVEVDSATVTFINGTSKSYAIKQRDEISGEKVFRADQKELDNSAR